MGKQVSIKQAITVVLVAVTLVLGIGIAVGYSFFWDQYEKVTLEDIQLENALKAVEKAPKDPKAHVALGYQYLKRNDTKKAIAEYEKAQKLAGPEDIITLLNLGIAYKEIGEKEKAIQNLEKVIKINQWHFIAQYNLAILYGDTKQYKKSLETFGIALQLEPGAADVLVSRARVYLSNGEFDKALVDVDKALRFVPDYQEAIELRKEIQNAKARTAK